MADTRALLASPRLQGQPVKGVYFFPGESAGNLDLYTARPLLPDDRHWNSDVSSRSRVIDRMLNAHVNTVVMSYWSMMPQWSPMMLDSGSLSGVLDAVDGRQMAILPAIESGFDPEHPDIPHWKFSHDFPSPVPNGHVAPGLVARIGELVALFGQRLHLWAQLYDRHGMPRHAVQLLHVCSDRPGVTDQTFANAFGHVAADVRARFGIDVGFLLDLIPGGGYVAAPATAGPWLEQEPAVLAANGYASEVHSGVQHSGPPCSDPDWRRCHPHDNNRDRLEQMADWKRRAVRDWAATGLPVILDVSNGMDGRIVWRKGGVGFWGDNYDYTEDRWRNWMSLLKGPEIKGITVDAWNGYTEGWAVVPSYEYGETAYSWLRDLLEPDPRHFSHMHYANGAPTFRVYGAICEKWVQLGADRGFGVPVTQELPTARGRVSFFWDGMARKAIHWSGVTGAHEVHGLIARTYWESGADSGPLGLPVSDEQPNGAGRVSRFEHGRIEWAPGDLQGRIVIP